MNNKEFWKFLKKLDDFDREYGKILELLDEMGIKPEPFYIDPSQAIGIDEHSLDLLKSNRRK